LSTSLLHNQSDIWNTLSTYYT